MTNTKQDKLLRKWTVSQAALNNAWIESEHRDYAKKIAVAQVRLLMRVKQ